ncbi:MAG: TolC family protein [Magnetococcales bacterium]|nr:TolC family protein [Magnetococcales bacterium]
MNKNNDLLGKWLSSLAAAAVIVLMPCQQIEAQEGSVDQPSSMKRQIAEDQTSVTRNARPLVPIALQGAHRLTLRDFVRLAMQENDTVRREELEARIAAAAIENAESVFEPILSGSVARERSFTRTDAVEQAQYSSLSEYRSRTNTIDIGVEGLLQTGARVKVGYAQEDPTNDLQKNVNQGHEVKTELEVSVTQPLLKNFGPRVTSTTVRIAEYDAEIAEQKRRQVMMETATKAIIGYQELQKAQMLWQLRRESLGKSQRLLDEMVQLMQAGRQPESAVLDAEANSIQRQVALRTAESALQTAVVKAQDLLLGSDDTRLPVQILAAESLSDPITNRVDRSDRMVQQALKEHPEIQSARLGTQREEERLVYADNQRLVQLDFSGSYSLNGLDRHGDSSLADAMKRDHSDWRMGLELKVPLGGGWKTRSEYNAALHKRDQAALEMHVAKKRLINGLQERMNAVDAARDQVAYARQALRLRERMLKSEQSMFKGGKSSLRTVIIREEGVLQAREQVLEKRFELARAQALLDMSRGVLLEMFGVEPTPVQREAS